MNAWSRDELLAFQELAEDIEDGRHDVCRLPALEKPLSAVVASLSMTLSDGRRLTRIKTNSLECANVLYIDFLNGSPEGAEVPLA